jgi:hypothetical protein
MGDAPTRPSPRVIPPASSTSFQQHFSSGSCYTLTSRFRRVNCRAMELVDSVHQYAAIIKHCHTIICAIVSMETDAFDCDVLYTTLSTTPCSTCERFGDHLYLIDCRRVCYFYFTGS